VIRNDDNRHHRAVGLIIISWYRTRAASLRDHGQWANGLKRMARVVARASSRNPSSAAGYFHPRPSAAGTGYDAHQLRRNETSIKSKLIDSVTADVATAQAENPGSRPGRRSQPLASGLEPTSRQPPRNSSCANLQSPWNERRRSRASVANTPWEQWDFREPRAMCMDMNLSLIPVQVW